MCCFVWHWHMIYVLAAAWVFARAPCTSSTNAENAQHYVWYQGSRLGHVVGAAHQNACAQLLLFDVLNYLTVT